MRQLGWTLISLAVICGLAAPSSAQAQAQDGEAARIVADQVRSQGYACAQPAQATRDAESSRPGEPVWLLECADAKYRVRLIPDQAAEISRID